MTGDDKRVFPIERGGSELHVSDDGVEDPRGRGEWRGIYRRGSGRWLIEQEVQSYQPLAQPNDESAISPTVTLCPPHLLPMRRPGSPAGLRPSRDDTS